MTHNIRILPDHPTLDSIPLSDYFDILILPGGGPGAKTFCLWHNDRYPNSRRSDNASPA